MATVAELEKRIEALEAFVVDSQTPKFTRPYLGQAVQTVYKGKTRPALVVGVNQSADVFDLQVVMDSQCGRDINPLELVNGVALAAIDFEL